MTQRTTISRATPPNSIHSFMSGVERRLLTGMALGFVTLTYVYYRWGRPCCPLLWQRQAFRSPSRVYTDRLNAPFSPLGWTREYKIETMNNITRVKKGESIVSGKVLFTCTVTIIGLWSHSETGEDWPTTTTG